MSRRKIFSKRFLSLFLAAAMCVGLLQLPVLADGDCEYGQEGCVCTEETCLEACTVCHPVEGDEEDGEPPAGETDPSPAPVNLEDEGGEAPTMASNSLPAPVNLEGESGEAPAMVSNSLPASASLEDEAENLRAAIEGEASTYTLAGDVTGSFEIPAGKSFTLDLGGYTLHGGADSNYVIVNRGDLTLKNGTVENGARFGVENYGNLTMDGVTISSNNYTIDLYSGTISITSCSITSSAGMAIYTNQNTAPDLTISDSEVYGKERALNQWGTGKITAQNTTFKAGNKAPLESNRGSVELFGCMVDGDFCGNTSTIKPDSTTHYGNESWQKYAETKFSDSAIPEEDYIEMSDNGVRTIYVYSVDGLAWWASQVNGKALTGDYVLYIEAETLDLAAHMWDPINGEGSRMGTVTIHGREGGTTIKNMKAWGYTYLSKNYPYGGGFFGRIAGGGTENVTIENLTFDNANVAIQGDSMYYGNIVGVVIGQLYTGRSLTLRNVNVINSQVTGSGKVGGLIGQTNEEDVLLENCTVENTTVRGTENCGGLIGLNMNPKKVTITGCTAKATWAPNAKSTNYVCFVGNATREYTSEDPLTPPVAVSGTYHVSKDAVSSNTWGLIPGLFATWGDQYTDYQEYLADETIVGPAGIIGFSHDANLHTHIELTGTKCVDTGDGVSHKIVCAGCGADLKDLGYPHEPHTFKDNKCEKCSAEKHVARNVETGTLYTTLQLAVDAVEENGTATIEMINDSDRPATIPAGKTITLNVPEGITLTNNDGGRTILTNSGRLILNGEGKLDIYKSGYAVLNTGTAELNGCTLTTYTGDYVVWNKGIMEINGGRILKEKHASWDAVCNGRGAPNARLTINYCEITAKAEGDSCIGNQGATTIINGGVFRAQLPVENGITENPIDGPESRLTINGGKFIREDGPKPDGTINSVNNCAVLLVTGGDFYAVNMEKPIFLINSRSTSSTATVSGGTFYRGDIFHNGYCGETGCTVADPGSLYAFSGKDYDETTDAVRWRIGAPAMSLDKTAVTLSRNGTDTLTPVLDPNNAIYTAAEWSSDDTGVATVDANGVVTAHGPGTAAITCKVKVKTAVKDGTSGELVVVETELTAACTVTVSNSYTLTYNANGTGVTNLPGDQSGTGTVTISAQRPARGGYTFRGWAAAPGGAAVYQPGGSIDLTDSVTLYAVWTANSSGGGSGSGGSGGSGGGGGGGGSGGRGGGTNPVTIIDEEVPLAGDLLNKVDHFAYIAGYDDGTVRPNNPLTRAQVATIFYRLLTDLARDIYFQETNDFPDVPDDFWACKAISTLTNAGILGGFEDGTFRPNAYITRAQFAAMAARFDSVVPGLANPFSDVAEDYWARDLIAYAAFQGWVEGGGTFRPLENITRAEAMGFLNNVLERRVDAEGLVEGYTTFTDVPAGDPWYYVVAEATNTHDYTRREEGQPLENWTGLLENPVWDE